MADDSSTVSIVFKGSAQSVEDAIKRVSGQLGALDKTASAASSGLHKTAAAEGEVEAEARGLTRGMEVAADAMALFSKQSSEATRRLYEVRSLASDMRGAFQSMHGAILGGVTAFAGVAALGFLHSAVEEGLAGERAQAQLNAALKNNKDAIEATNRATEEGANTWARYGVTVGQLKTIMAGALGRGIAPEQILGNAKGISDIAVALHTDMGGAIDAITSGPRSLKALGRALNLNQMDLVSFNLRMQQARTEAGRFQVALDYISKSRFAGQGDALANTDTGKMLQFQTSVKDLEETLGTNLIPLLGNFANALNGIVQTANTLLAGFGGLSGVLSSKWVPIIALSLVGLKAFHGIVTMIEGLFRTKLVSTLMGARQELNQDTGAAEDLTAAIKGIPTDVTTMAHFEDTAAKAEKDGVYIPDLNLVDGRVVTTTATFIPANIPAEPALQPITVPVTYDTTNAFSEATATPISVPVTYNTQNAFSEAQATPIHVPVTYDAGKLTEAGATPIHVPVIYDGHLSARQSAPVKVPVIYAGHLSEDHSTPVRVPVIYNGTLTEQHGTPVKVPVIYQGTLHESSVHGLTVPVHPQAIEPQVEREITVAEQYARAHPIMVPVSVSGGVHVVSPKGGYVDITPRLSANAATQEATIRSQIQTGVNAGGPIPVMVKPRWTHDAMAGLTAGLAGGAAFGITDAIFGGAVTIKQATMPNVHMPTPTGGGGGGGTQTAIFQGPRQPVAVRVVNPGAIGSALGGGHTGPTGPMHVQIDGHPYVGLVPGQTLNVGNLPKNPIAPSSPTGATVTLPNNPIDVKAHQAGPWQISLNPDAIGRVMQMIAEMAIGSAIGNVIANIIPTGKILGALGGIFKGIGGLFKGGRGGGGGGGGPVLLPQTAASATGDFASIIEGVVTARGGVAVPSPTTAPFKFTKGHDPVVDALKGINWAGSIKAGLIAASFPLLAGAAVGAALLGGLGSIFGATGAEAASGPVKKARATAQAGFATIASDLIGQLVKAVADFVKNHNPFSGVNFGSGKNTDPNKPDARGLYGGDQNHPPHGDRNDFTYVSGRGYSGWRLKPGHHVPPGMGSVTGGGAGLGGLTNVTPSLAAHLSAMTGLHMPTGVAAARAGGHTVNVHAGAIVVNGAQSPQAVATEVSKQLQQFVRAL